MNNKRRFEVTGVGLEIFVASQHQCSQRIVPEEIIITVGSPVVQGATAIPVTATPNTKRILAPIWLDVQGDDGSDVTVCVTDDIDPGATSLTILEARLAIPANATAEYPPRLMGAISSNIEPTKNLDTTTPLDQGGYEVSAYTGSGASISCEFPYFLAAAEMAIKWADDNSELVFIKEILPNPTCPDDNSYSNRPVRSGFCHVESGVPTPLEGGTVIRHSVTFKLDGKWYENTNTSHLTPPI